MINSGGLLATGTQSHVFTLIKMTGTRLPQWQQPLPPASVKCHCVSPCDSTTPVCGPMQGILKFSFLLMLITLWSNRIGHSIFKIFRYTLQISTKHFCTHRVPLPQKLTYKLNKFSFLSHFLSFKSVLTLNEDKFNSYPKYI